MMLATMLLQRGVQQCQRAISLLRFVAPVSASTLQHRYAPADWGEQLTADHVERLEALQGRWHISLPVPADKPVFVIGDVHGCIDEFTDMLKMAPADATIVCVGDLVNKGPDSLGCLRLAQQHNVLCLRGNHEEAALHWRYVREREPHKRPDWAWVDGLSASDLKYMNHMPFSVSFPYHNLLVVHAGLVPHEPMSMQHPLHMTKMRSLEAIPGWIRLVGRSWRLLQGLVEGVSQPPVPAFRCSDGEGQPWASFWPSKGGSDSKVPRVVFGHDAKRRLQKYDGALGIDTGCLYGNGLTAWLSPDDKLFEVPSRQVYVLPGRKYVPPAETVAVPASAAPAADQQSA